MNHLNPRLSILYPFLLILLLCAAASLKAQQVHDLPEKKFKHEIGAGAGFTTGYGLSYRYRPCRFGAQVNFAPYVDSETSRYSLGLTFLYTLVESKYSNLFIYQGNHYYYNSETVDTYYPYQMNPVKVRTSESYFNNGVGMGIEIIIARRVGFNIMAGYAAYKNFTQLNVTGETALYFKF